MNELRDSVSSEYQPPSTSISRRIAQWLGQFWAWLFLIILLVFFSLTGKGFFSLFNLQSIGANAAILLILALGQTFVIISGGIDLSTGYLLGLVSVVAAAVMTATADKLPVPAAVLTGMMAALLVGVGSGWLNGVIIARLHVPPFIVTLGMQGVLRGIGFVLSGGMPLPIFIKNLGVLGNGSLLYYSQKTGFTFFGPPPGLEGPQLRQVIAILPYPLILGLLLVMICHLVLSRMRFGLYTYAVGGSKEAASRAGIPVESHTTKVYVVSALLASIAGLLYAVRFTTGTASAGEALTLDSVAAVVIGGASLFGGEGTIIGTLIGTLTISVIVNGLVILGVNAFWQYVAVGIVIILAVLADQTKSRLLK